MNNDGNRSATVPGASDELLTVTTSRHHALDSAKSFLGMFVLSVVSLAINLGETEGAAAWGQAVGGPVLFGFATVATYAWSRSCRLVVTEAGIASSRGRRQEFIAWDDVQELEPAGHAWWLRYVQARTVDGSRVTLAAPVLLLFASKSSRLAFNDARAELQRIATARLGDRS